MSDHVSEPGRAQENNVISLASKRAKLKPSSSEDAALASLRAALGGLRREIRTQLPRRQQGSEAVPGPKGASDWWALVDELRVRLGQLGMRESSGEVDEFGMDLDLMTRTRPLLEFLAARYWRIGMGGVRHGAVQGPALYVANRGGLLPYDGFMLAHLVDSLVGRASRQTRFLVDGELMALPFLQPTLARSGGVLALPENMERLFAAGHSAILFPEGTRGAIKTFDQRYELQNFGGQDLVEVALSAGVPIIPVGIVGAEETQPMLFRSYLLAWTLGLPFLPVTPTFPLLGPLGLLPLPSRWAVEFGPALETRLLADPTVSGEPISGVALGRLRDRVSELIDRGRERRPSAWT